MIENGEIKNILRKLVLASSFGSIKVYKSETSVPSITREANFERVLINVLINRKGGWSEGVANVNICVPDINPRGYWESNEARLTELNKKAIAWVGDGLVGDNNGSKYAFFLDSVREERDEATFSHFINIRLNFQTL